MRNLQILLLSSILVCGCVVQVNPPKPAPKPDEPAPVVKNDAGVSVKMYCLKASQVFAEAAVILKRDKDIQAIHNYLQTNLASGRSESFKGMDNRLQEILGADKPDIDKGVNLLNKISQEFKEMSK